MCECLSRPGLVPPAIADIIHLTSPIMHPMRRFDQARPFLTLGVVLLAWLALAGPGTLSLDRLIARRVAAPTSPAMPVAIIAGGSAPNARL